MNAKDNLEKSATVLTPEQKAILAKYLKAGVGAGVLASGVGLALSRAKANKERASRKPEESKNAIIVDIRKDNFLKDIPTPEDQKNMVSGTKLLAQPSAAGGQQAMTPEEIAAIKKDVLRRNERKMNFFGKAAAPVSDGNNGAEAQAQKTAQDSGIEWFNSIKNLILHPVNTGKGMIDAAKTRPLAMAAGGVGAIYLSAMIVDKVNEMRAKSSKRTANAARQEYVRLLQGGDDAEKNAQAASQYGDDKNLFAAAGTVMGTSFVVPAVLAAIITNKIMERRKEKDKKAKSMTNSFPEEPLILYKTSEAKEIPIKPETALIAIMLKQAMMEDLEAEKSAGAMDKIRNVKDKFIDWANSTATEAKDYLSDPYGTAANKIIDQMENPENSGLVRNMADAYLDRQNVSFGDHVKTLGIKAGIPATVVAAWNPDEVKRRIAANKRTGNVLVNMVNSDSWKDWREARTADFLEKSRLFRKGSPIFNIIQWVMNNLGVGKFFARNAIQNKLQAMSAPQKV